MKIAEHHIDQYVMGKLSPSERASFVKELKNNQQLQREVEQRRQIVGGLSKLQHKMTRDKMREFAKRQATAAPTQEAKVVPMRSRRRWLAVAASVLVLLASVFVIKNMTSPQSMDTLAGAALLKTQPNAERFQIEKGTFGTRGEGGQSDAAPTDTEKVMVEVAKEYEHQDYQKALTRIKSLPQDTLLKYQSETYFRIGILHLLNENPAEAITFLKEVDTKEANWYQALALLKIANREVEGKAIIEQIANDKKPHPFKKEAELLLQNF